jgi:hypothetical protein
VFTTTCELESRAAFEKWPASDMLAVARKNVAEVMRGKDMVWTGGAFYAPMAHFGDGYLSDSSVAGRGTAASRRQVRHDQQVALATCGG